jgi:hypothetical protein
MMINECNEPITRLEWEGMWRALDEMKRLPLVQYCAACDAIKAAWRTRYPKANFSNGRYAAYIEDCLRRGLTVGPGIIATLTPRDLRFDAHAFPYLAPRLGIALERHPS